MNDQDILNVIKNNNNLVATSKIAKELGLHYYDALRKLEDLEKGGILESREFGSNKRKTRVWSVKSEVYKSGEDEPGKDRNS